MILPYKECNRNPQGLPLDPKIHFFSRSLRLDGYKMTTKMEGTIPYKSNPGPKTQLKCLIAILDI